MNTNVIAMVSLSVLLGAVVGVSVGPQADATETPPQTSASEDDFGGDVSAFMQRSSAAANGSVDSGMWRAAFETAENQSRKQALVGRRAAVLGARLDRLETRIERFSFGPNRSVTHRARWVRLAADRNALRTSIAEAKTTAASEGVNATALDRLDRRIADLSIPNAAESPSTTTARNETTTNRDTAAVAPDDRPTAGMTYGGP